MRTRALEIPALVLASWVLAVSSGCVEPGDDAADDAAADAGTGMSEDPGEADAGDEDDDGSAGAGETESLVDVEAWTLDPMVPGPLAADRPDAVQCEHGFGLEDGLFEVDTELCNWGAFSQPTLAPIRAGDTVEIIMLHDTLYSEDDDAVAHLAVAIGDVMVWDTTVAIPAPPGYLRPMITVEADVEAGTPLHLHVHNHGYNNYRVVDITVTH